MIILIIIKNYQLKKINNVLIINKQMKIINMINKIIIKDNNYK